MQHPRALLDAHGLRPKKRFGQNFLVDAAASQRIAQLAIAGSLDVRRERILEIGAGTGALTTALVRTGAQITALEIDPELDAILRSREDLCDATIVRADALAFDYAEYARGERWLVAGNLPYNVATPLIGLLTEMDGGPASMTVMIQKDVAARLAAQPGTAAYGSLSIAVQYAMTVERAFTLGPAAFHPRPKVDSTVVHLVRRSAPAVRPRDLALFRKVVRAAFAYRRKTLANSLALALDIGRDKLARAILAADLDPELRGERLDIHDFARLADALAAE